MLEGIADRLRSGNKVILVHGNADMDAVGSAYALKRAFPNADIYAPNGVDRVARVVLDKMEVPIRESCRFSDYDTVVVVDTSSPEQLEMPEGMSIPEDAIIIDHHIPSGKWGGYEFYCDDTKTSCCEIVKEMLDACGVPIERDMGLMLLGGMITDSGHFQHAKPELLTAFADILERCDIGMDEAFTLTMVPVSMSERVAMLKTIERTKFDRVGEMIVATAFGGSFEASSCRAILDAGADVVFVASQRDETFRLSARATQDAVRKGVNLGDIIKGIGQETDTDGGGHTGAAGISGIGDAEAMLFICMKRTMEVFRDIKAAGLLEK